MKLKLNMLFEAMPALREIGSIKEGMDGKTLFAIAKFLQAADNESKAFSEAQKGILEKLDIKVDDRGGFTTTAEYNEEMEKVLETEVELPDLSLSLDLLAGNVDAIRLTKVMFLVVE